MNIDERLMEVILAYHSDTYYHSMRVTDYCLELGTQLGLSVERMQELKTAAMLHDIGKLLIPVSILDKPGKLSDYEIGEIRHHPSYGYSIMKALGYKESICTAVLEHHERIDGCGYLNKRRVCMDARIIGVADAFDAMTSSRPYSPPRGTETVRDELTRNAGTQFDDVLSALACRVFT